MKLSQIALTVVLSAVVAYGVSVGTALENGTIQSAPPIAKKETAFERVMRTNTLRCGYVLMPPQLGRDPNTGAFYGIAYDITTEMAKRIGLKTEWTEEVSFITMGEGLKTGRYDAFCFTSYRWVPSARAMDYTSPLFYMTTDAYVRADDNRFDADLKSINKPEIKVATIDGEAAVTIRENDFPQSSVFTMPSNSDMGLVLESVKTRKADVALVNPVQAMPYLLSHKNDIKRVEGHTPIRVWSLGLGVGKGEPDLLSMLNLALDEMHLDGTIDKILDKYEAIPNSFVRVKNATSAR